MMLYSLTPFCEFCSRRLADYANDCRCGDAPENGMRVSLKLSGFRNASIGPCELISYD